MVPTALTAPIDIGQDAAISLTHMAMLTQEDLKQIGQVVDQKLDEKLEPVLEAVREGFEAVDRRFEGMETRMTVVEKKMATKTEMNTLKHELMDHTDRTVTKAVGELRSELRERNVIA
jgi:hypothetical protein